MDKLTLTFTAKLWIYSGKAAWHFVTLPAEDGQQVKFFTQTRPKKGWGSVRVSAAIGGSRWQTSLFPDKSSGSYVLPIKADIRRKEKIHDGDQVTVNLEISL